MFTFKDEYERVNFIEYVSRRGNYLLKDLLGDMQWYLEEYEDYLRMVTNDPSILDSLRASYWAVQDEGVGKWLTSKIELMHLLEIPFKDVPLYLNSGIPKVSVVSQWRLKVGR